MEKMLLGLLCVGAGLFTIVCSAKQYEWFIQHRKARAVSAIIGSTGTRIFYIVLGVVLTLAGLGFLLHPALAV